MKQTSRLSMKINQVNIYYYGRKTGQKFPFGLRSLLQQLYVTLICFL